MKTSPVRNRRPRRRGFTLMEVLLVLAILVILASMASVFVIKMRKSAFEDLAKQQVGSFSQALDAYYMHLGMYPTTSQGLEALRAAPSDLRDPAKWRGPYLNKEIPQDPWGNPYQYEMSSADQYRIWSWGPDMQNSTADDIANL
ncbi:MAG: type II secretion system major pseudopilin GspG [Pirellulaceae bacterium]|nr:type II secretion system major pseudopilin GspG [Planctomycetales bacterium]MCA9220035.1 type II secretion system major pseudopilin GspG [Planctomycetales bacterium]MCA9228467.1 type II secretion system major pseudopilin GspG [Planctomycetales bacterium]